MERNITSNNWKGLVLLLLLFFTSCVRNPVPAISNVRVQEVKASLVEVTATVSPDDVDECGICYSTSNTKPTPEANEGIIYGIVEGGRFSAQATLKANTTYYIAVFASNNAGRTTSTAFKFTTSHVSPNKEDNPLPNT